MTVTIRLGILVVAALVGWVHVTVAAPAKGNPEAGKKLFIESCQHCHGQKGDGQSEMAGYLTPPPSNLTVKATQAKTDAQLRAIIAEGKAGTAMSGFGGSFEETQLNDLVAFLRSLK